MPLTLHPDLHKLPQEELRRRIAVTRLQPVLLQSMNRDLGGLPYPIHFRNQGAIERWLHILDSTDSGKEFRRQMVRPTLTSGAAIDTIENMLLNLIQPSNDDDKREWKHAATIVAMNVSANLLYTLRNGTLIEATPALEELLAHSDVDKDMPMGMLALPFLAQYLCFGEYATRTFSYIRANGEQIAIDGAFCFVSHYPDANNAQITTQHLHLMLVLKENGKHNGFLQFEQPLTSPDMSLSEWVAQACDSQTALVSPMERERILEILSYIAKVFLYLGLKDARQIQIREHSDAKKRLEGLGAKKQAKFGRRLDALYDRIVVGPSAMPEMQGMSGVDHAVSPHWRRGHFRMQTHGIRHRERKLIFVAPMMVRADLLQTELPTPKMYRAR